MSSPLEVELLKLIECPVCFEIFDRPRMLWCAHAFCQRCVTQLVDAGKILCPLCRKITKAYRLSNLPKAYFVQDLIQFHKKMKSIRSGPPVIIVSPVTVPSKSEAGENNAPYLVELTKRSASEVSLSNVLTSKESTTNSGFRRVSSTRSVVSLGEGDFNADENGKEFSTCAECEIQSSVTNLWVCVDCSIVACSRCTMMQHRCHQVVLAADMRSERKLAVTRWLRQMTIAIDRMYTNRTDINCEMTSLKFSRLLLSANLTNFDAQSNWSLPDNEQSNLAACSSSGNNTPQLLSNPNQDEKSTPQLLATFLSLENLSDELKQEFDSLVSRLNTVRSESFLYSDAHYFAEQLNTLPHKISKLMAKQEHAIELQQLVRIEMNKVHSNE